MVLFSNSSHHFRDKCRYIGQHLFSGYMSLWISLMSSLLERGNIVVGNCTSHKRTGICNSELIPMCKTVRVEIIVARQWQELMKVSDPYWFTTYNQIFITHNGTWVSWNWLLSGFQTCVTITILYVDCNFFMPWWIGHE